MNYINKSFTLVVIAMVVAVSSAMLPAAAFAQEDGSGGDGGCCDIIDTGWNNNDIIDTGWNNQNDIIDTGWNNNDIYDTGWNNQNDIIDTGWNNGSYVDTATYQYGNENYYTDTGYQTAYQNQSSYYTSTPQYASYQQQYQQPHSYASAPSYYPQTPPYYPSTPAPYYPPTPAPYVPPAPHPSPQPQPYIPPVVQPVANTTNNTCTNGSCNYTDNSVTKIDNSINGSFNAYNSGNTNIVPVTPQPIIQYQFTQPITYPVYQPVVQPVYQPVVQPVYQNIYCTITASPTSIQNGQAAYLSWTSNGTSAVLSDGIGAVAANGSLTVRPDHSLTYVLTVYGQGGTNSCSVTINVSGAPYVSLTQIPYTGFDFGPVGDALYWLGLISFAVAGAYLAVYYKGGALALAGTMMGSRQSHIAAAESTITETSTSEEAPVETEETHEANAFESLPVAEARTMKDSMAIVHGTDGTPRIVINRA